MRDSAGASFDFLSDPDGKLLDALDMRHVGARYDGADMAQSASFLIAPDGRLLWSKVAENYRIRPKPEEVLEAIDRHLAPAS